VSGGLAQCTNAASYMDVCNYHGNWFLRIVWSLCENCVLYFLLSHCQNKEPFPMLTSLNGTFASAGLMRLPFFFCFDFESVLRASSFMCCLPVVMMLYPVMTLKCLSVEIEQE